MFLCFNRGMKIPISIYFLNKLQRKELSSFFADIAKLCLSGSVGYFVLPNSSIISRLLMLAIGVFVGIAFLYFSLFLLEEEYAHLPSFP